MGYHYTNEEREAFEARVAERKARELMQHETLHEALGHLIAMKRLNLSPTNSNLLWAEWHYAKAMHDLYGDDSTGEMFACACNELGVDADGLDGSEGGENFGASHPDAGKGFRL